MTPAAQPNLLGSWTGLADQAGVADCLAWSEALCAESPFDAAVAFALRLAIEEVCVNVADHGYRGSSPGPLSVAVWLSGDPTDNRVEVEIRDRAVPFDPQTAPQPDLEAEVQDRRVGGLGWFLIRQLMDDLQYRSHAGENCLRMVKKLSSAAGVKP